MIVEVNKEREEELASQIYDLLVEYGARPSDKGSFVHYFLEMNDLEYRFQGIFGFGGKFGTRRHPWTNRYCNFQAYYYPENRTEALDEKVRELNEKLGGIESDYSEEYEEKTS